MPVIQLDGIKLNYLLMEPADAIATPQPTVVMVHGLATNLAFWHRLATTLADTYRVLLFDLRGHGRSSMPLTGYTSSQMAIDLHQLLLALNIEPTVLMGHSFGGTVVLHYALRWPVSHLVLADSRLKALQTQQQPKDWPHWSRLQTALGHLGIELREDEPEAGYRLLKELARVQVHEPERLATAPKWMSYLYPQSAGKKTARQWLKLLDNTNAWQELTTDDDLSRSTLQQLQLPVLAVYGENSPTLKTGKQLPKLWPQVELQLLTEAGHFFPMSQPQRFLTLLQPFLALACNTAV